MTPTAIGSDTAGPRLLPDPEESPTIELWPIAGKALNLGRSATYAAAARGEIPTIHLGRRIVVPTAALRRMLSLDGGPRDAA